MSKDFSIKISDFTGIFRAMAEKANSNGDEVLDYNETSIFNAIRKTHDKKHNTFIYDDILFDANGKEFSYIAEKKTDALNFKYLYKETFQDEQKNMLALKKADTVPAAENSIINIKKDAKYNDIRKVVRAKIGDAATEDKTKEIAQMVIELCKKYEIYELSPLIAHILGYETGGYVFTKEKMDPEWKKYKGVMQVDPQTCKCIFSEGGAIYENDHKAHFSQDDARIEVLRKKYGNAKNLYEAMKTDVKLGLEVGIIAYKAKLHETKGNIATALRKYCGGDYVYPFDNIPKKFDVSKPKQ